MHPDDPPRSDPLGGAARVLSSLEDFELLFELAPGPANAMLFCQGCVAEMGEDIPAAIRRMAALDKIIMFDLSLIGAPAALLASFDPPGTPQVPVADDPGTVDIENTLGNQETGPTGVPAVTELRINFTPAGNPN